MEAIKSCSGCGAALPTDAPQGLCPRCLMKLGLATRSAAAEAPGDGGPVARAFTPPSPAELEGHFPQIEVLKLLGQGGMGAVYQARQRGLDRTVALKILPPAAGADPSFAERFTREARALARLNHPSIVTVYDFGRAGEYFYFIMEFVDGANLREMIRGGVLKPREALAIVPQVCDALQYAHDEGIVHRDIKPENILLDRKGRVKIADFGLAKLLGRPAGIDQLTGPLQVMGTPRYMAPEQIERPQEVDHRADIYSLGVVFYEMLTGEVPMGRFALPSEKVQIDVRLDEVVLRTLAREPDRRYQRVNDLKSEVEGITGMVANLPAGMRRAFGVEYRSKAMLFGLPLVHIASGTNPATGRRRVARGIIAIGDQARGVLAIGGVAVGVLSFGGAAVGLFACGGLSLGALVIGGVGVGLLASYSGVALAPVAMGGLAVGYYAFGGAAFGVHAAGGNARDPRAIEFFRSWAGMWVLYLALFLSLVSTAISFSVPALLQRREERKLKRPA